MKILRIVNINKHRFIIVLLVGLGLLIAGSASAADAPEAAKAQNAETEGQKPDTEDQKSEKTTPEEVDAQLAGMSDQQVRQALADKLKQEAAEDSSAVDTGDIGEGDDSEGHRFHDLTLGA